MLSSLIEVVDILVHMYTLLSPVQIEVVTVTLQFTVYLQFTDQI